MDDIIYLFYELIRVSTGTQDCLSRLPSVRGWYKLFRMAEMQSLTGICFVGLQRLGADANDGFDRIGMPEDLYFQWTGIAAQIQQRNKELNQQCIKLQARLAAEGFKTCILKGQGLALLYNTSLPSQTSTLGTLRQSGDIDIWMDGGFERVNNWVQMVAPTKIVNQHHVALKVFDETEVEAHYHPINMTNPWRQRALIDFIKAHEDECFANRIYLHNNLNHNDNPQMCVPTTEFNLVFLMVHIYHHLFTEGVGLRQIMDYYFVLCTVSSSNFQKALPDGQAKKPVQDVIRDLGMERFASALMWVIKTVFVGHNNVNTNDNFFLGFEPNEKDGRFLLEEIMKSGNFGKQDKRQNGLYKSKWNSFWMIHMKTFRFWRFDHWAWFWSPIQRIRGYAWRRMHGYKQY